MARARDPRPACPPLAALAALTLALAACGGGGGEDSAGGGPSAPAGSTLRGVVGPGFEIRLETEEGAPVTSLAPGRYRLVVEDRSAAHDFHLTGPGGVDVATGVAEEGERTFELDLEPGTYRYVCDPHASSMQGSFEVAPSRY